ncbi:MAG TPA: gluconate 2-dehydrogenase subunit 3 family protein [Lacunisphaera sp.]|nr:gluconate 2-dehydrogenase subunit 3 family protein [Lacunisphaera sp.]
MNPPSTLTRREVLARLGVLLGGALIGGDTWLRGGTLAGKSPGNGFTADEVELLDEIGETIIPATDTPGAKAAGIGAFMAMMVVDCYDEAHHAAFKAGLDRLAREGFLAASPAERTARLNALDGEQRRHQAAKEPTEPAHYFRMMKQLTILGFFTSEIGAAQVLLFEEVPGRFDGNAPYHPGDRYLFTPPNRAL